MYDSLAFVSAGDLAAIITAVTGVGVLLGGVLAFLLHNEGRISALEQAQGRYKDDAQATRDAIKALHERLDAFFLGSGPRARPHGKEE